MPFCEFYPTFKLSRAVPIVIGMNRKIYLHFQVVPSGFEPLTPTLSV